MHPALFARASAPTYRVHLVADDEVTCPDCGTTFHPGRKPLPSAAVDLASRIVWFVRRQGGVARIRDTYRALRVTRATFDVAAHVILTRGLGVVVAGRPKRFKVFG